MKGLSRERSIFHSKADFQHALARYIHKKMPHCQVRLEFKPFEDNNIYLDIWIRDRDRRIAMELKYKTKKLVLLSDDEFFALRNQGAQDYCRYDFIKDIYRLEQVVPHLGPAKVGFVVLLTNDPSYWKPSKKKDPMDAAFRLDEHEGRKIVGEKHGLIRSTWK